MAENTRTTVSIPNDLWQKITKLASDERRSNNAQMVKILEDYFKSKE
jgi:hypothetical protein